MNSGSSRRICSIQTTHLSCPCKSEFYYEGNEQLWSQRHAALLVPLKTVWLFSDMEPSSFSSFATAFPVAGAWFKRWQCLLDRKESRPGIFRQVVEALLQIRQRVMIWTNV